MNEVKLPESIRRLTDEFVARLEAIYRNDLISVILYGSAARGEYANRYSNVNLLVVLNDAGLFSLERVRSITSSFKFQALNVLFFTEDYIRRSVDLFPIEFIDMQENHVVLYGKDIITAIDIVPHHLKFQCEHELKSKLINLKRFYLKNSNKASLIKFLVKTTTSSLHVIRMLLRLTGKGRDSSREAILREIGRAFGVDTAHFVRILETKFSNRMLDRREAELLYVTFVADLETIISIVDRMPS